MLLRVNTSGRGIVWRRERRLFLMYKIERSVRVPLLAVSGYSIGEKGTEKNDRREDPACYYRVSTKGFRAAREETEPFLSSSS